jgi:hypothetical protein
MSSFQISKARLKQIIREEQGNLAKAAPLTEFTEQGDKYATQYVVNRLEARGFDLALKAVMAEDEMQMGGYNRGNVREAAMDILDRITGPNRQSATENKEPAPSAGEEKNENLDLEDLIRQELLAALSGE